MTSPDTSSDPGTRPRPQQSKLIVSFAIGSIIGLWLAFPAIRPVIFTHLTSQSLGSVGRALAVGVMLMTAVTLGMVVLFQLFMFMDQ